MSRTGGAVAVLAIIVGACSSGSGGPLQVVTEVMPNLPVQETAAYLCGTDGGCGPDSGCAYAIDAGCGAMGVCVPLIPDPAPCKAFNFCGCDGVVVLGLCNLPNDFSPAPTRGLYL